MLRESEDARTRRQAPTSEPPARRCSAPLVRSVLPSSQASAGCPTSCTASSGTSRCRPRRRPVGYSATWRIRPSSSPWEMTLTTSSEPSHHAPLQYNEHGLREAIVSVWGGYGWHVDVYDIVLKMAEAAPI